jgi:dethiobiotin synthetase
MPPADSSLTRRRQTPSGLVLQSDADYPTCCRLLPHDRSTADVLGPPHPAKGTCRGHRWPDDTDIVIIETVGGVHSPLAHDGDSVDLIRCLQPACLLVVAEAGLGTLNAVRLTLSCIHPWPVEVFLNRFDATDRLHRSNLEGLAEHDGVEAVTAIAGCRQHVRSRAERDHSSNIQRRDS